MAELELALGNPLLNLHPGRVGLSKLLEGLVTPARLEIQLAAGEVRDLAGNGVLRCARGQLVGVLEGGIRLAGVAIDVRERHLERHRISRRYDVQGGEVLRDRAAVAINRIDRRDI